MSVRLLGEAIISIIGRTVPWQRSAANTKQGRGDEDKQTSAFKGGSLRERIRPWSSSLRICDHIWKNLANKIKIRSAQNVLQDVSCGETNRNDAELQSRATRKSCKVIGADEDNSHRIFRLGREILLILEHREIQDGRIQHKLTAEQVYGPTGSNDD